MAIKYRENGQSVTRANIGGGGGSTQITVETPTVTNATPYKYTGSALGPTITWDSSAMANYVNITNATGTAVGQYVLTLALKNPTLSMWDDLTTADKTYNYDIIPDGATATANDVQTLLKCADIFDKDYTTISEVLADSSSLAQIISSENAIDYLVRSTTWTTDVCSDSGAMGLIGLNNYAANTLLADSTWLNAICNSTYFESVLNVKVPTMTSNTTPSGEAFASSIASDGYQPYKAFDGGTSQANIWIQETNTTSSYIGYDFTSPMALIKADVIVHVYYPSILSFTAYLEGFNSNNQWEEITNFTLSGWDSGDIKNIPFSFLINSPVSYPKYRIRQNEKLRPSAYSSIGYAEIQFYGREDV